MTPRQIELLENTLSELRHRSVFAAQLFYCRLFARRPGLRRMFGGAPDFHGTRLFSVMRAAVAGLADRRDFRGQGNHAEVIGDALHWMLERHFHGQLTAEVREAWRAAYPRIAQAVENELH
jgi:hemoglobin-like flavoprotein